MVRTLPICIALCLTLAPLAVGADEEWSVPSYAFVPDTIDVVHGTIGEVDRYGLRLLDDRGYTDNVQLVRGTIINPRGRRLEPGMRIDVMGRNWGAALLALRIDTGPAPSQASMLAFERHNRAAAHLAAERLAARLEHLYGPRPAPKAVVHHPPPARVTHLAMTAPEARVTTHPVAQTRTPVKPAPSPPPEQRWFGWGKL